MSGDQPDADDEIDEDETTSRERLEQSADRAVEEFDRRVIDLLSWLLDTETRAKIYIYLHQHPASTSEEVAKGTGLYPSTVREALASLHEEEVVNREKRESSGAGNNPYQYTAIPPSDFVSSKVSDVQAELNAVFNLEEYLGHEADEPSEESQPVTITVDEPGADESTDGESAEAVDGDDEST
ncbi:MAG: putative transcriptional regulator [Halobacteriales archaeon]|jgi:predicted transcriptional regulator